METSSTGVVKKAVSALYAAFQSDKDLEKKGIDLQYGTTTRGTVVINGEETPKQVPVIFTIARAGGHNARFDKVFEHKTKPYKRMIQTDSLDPELGKTLMRETYAETVVLGWQNVQGSDGEFLEFTQANVIQILTDLPDLFVDIQVQANKQALFRVVVVEEDVKN